MSKKQPIIKSFFQPKAKDYVLSSKPLHVKPWGYMKSNNNKTKINNNVNISSSDVISLLSSDEDDENDNSIANKMRKIEGESNLPINSTTDELKMEIIETSKVLSPTTIDELKMEIRETSQVLSPSTTGELKMEIRETSNFLSPSKTSHNSLLDDSGELSDTTEFLDVVIHEDEGSFGTEKKTLSQEPLSDYKLNNFVSMVNWVLSDQSNDHLFNEDDLTVINNFKSMSVLSQRLYVRLYVRKHRWIRSSKISYPELGNDMKTICDELVQKRLLLPCNVIDNLEEVLELLDPAELKSCAKSINVVNPKTTSKQSLIEAILKHAKSSRSIQNYFSTKNLSVAETILHHVKKMLGSTAFCIDENSGRLFSRMSYLFYPPQVNEDENGVTLSQQLFNQLKVENGELVYPMYTINKKEIIYKNRQDLVLYETACRLENQILVATEKKNFDVLITQHLPQAESEFHKIFSNRYHIIDLLLPTYLRNQTAGHLYTRCLNHLVTVLEQQKNHQKAVEILRLISEQNVYCQYYKGKWLERLAIDLDKHLKKPNEALEVIVNGLKDTNVKAGFRYSIYQRGQRLAKSLKSDIPVTFSNCSEYDLDKYPEVTITAETLDRNVNGRKNIFTTTNEDGDITCIPVEEAAHRHYRKNGFTQGMHSEGIVYHALLNLLLWDIIYSDVTDAFRTCNQTLPLDFSSEDFYHRRAEQIEHRFCEIKSFSQHDLESTLEQVWTNNHGTSCLIAWDVLEIQNLKDIAYCLGNAVLIAILKRMCSHIRFTQSGFPDLLVWNAETKMIKAVEVKGPNDILSSKQILWLHYFNANGFSAEVCYVKSEKNSRK